MHSIDKLILENKAWAAEKVADDPEYFGRLAHLRVIAETPVYEGNRDWPATPRNFERIVEVLLRDTQAKAVVSDVPPAELLNGWTEIPGTIYRVLRLERN